MLPLLQFIQKSFKGGMDQSVDPTRIPDNCYSLLINGRSRYDVLQPVKQPRQDTSLPNGNYQGVYASGQYGIVFVDGKAYYRDYSFAGTQYIQIDQFQMDQVQPTFWAELVPASTLNYKRVPSSTDITSSVALTSQVNGTPQALVVQDGISQPWIITPDAKARPAQTYAQWQVDNREYVPIMRNMLFTGSILYGVAPNCCNILRSVSGRPLDFMVNIQPTTGDKPAATEDAGGAQTASHRVGYDTITSLNELNTPDGGFFVSTARNSYKVTPDFTSLVWGEPQFDNTPLFPTGCLNQFSFVDILGDSAFIDFTGIRSFNAVLQFRYEGRNSPFSAKVFNLFKDVTQINPCAGKFDNFALFSVNTIYGSGVLIYDEIAQCWVGLDIYPGLAPIRQFAEVKTVAFRKLLFITTDNKLFEAYGSANTAPLKAYVGEWTTQDPKVIQSGLVFKMVLSDIKESGILTVTPFVDRLKETPIPIKINANLPTNPIPLAIPFGISTADTTQLKTFEIGRVQRGWKVGILIEMDFDATISHLSLTSEPMPQEVPPDEEADNFSRLFIDAGQLKIPPLPPAPPYVPPPPVVPTGSFLEQESGSDILLEGGGRIELE